MPGRYYYSHGFVFGTHWDDPYHPDRVIQSIEKGTYLPGGYYSYPSVTYWLCIVDVLPDALYVTASHTRSGKDRILKCIQSKNYLLRTRMLFAVVSMLSLVWVYQLVLIWRKSAWIALAASCALGLSWEVGYHIRWIAPDAVLMQFASLTTLCVVRARLFPENRKLLNYAAIGAGLAAGTKYPGALLMLPVWVVAYQNNYNNQAVRERFAPFLVTLKTFLITYLLTTPGTLLQPLAFVHGVLFEMHHYRTGHPYHTVVAGPQHFSYIVGFLALALFSHYPPIALGLFLCTLVGVIGLYRESRPMLYLLMSFPLTYVLYMSSQRVFIVRNLLVLAPCLAILAALGLAYLYQSINHRIGRLSLVAASGCIFGINAYWLFFAAQSIAVRNRSTGLQKFAAYARAHPELQVSLSDGVRSLLSKTGYGHDPPLQNRENYTLLAILPNEVSGLFPACNPHRFAKEFGAYEVNIDYYPDWLQKNTLDRRFYPKWAQSTDFYGDCSQWIVLEEKR